MSFHLLIIVFVLFLLEYIETCPTGCNCVNSMANSCSSCKSGYYNINQGNPVECGRCKENCETCSSYTDCD